MGLIAVGLVGVAGVLTGVATRRWLAWLRRGAEVPLRWCAAGVGILWAGVAAGWEAGVLAVPVVPLVLGLCWLVVAGSLVDATVHRLPDALTLPAIPGAVALLAPLGWQAVVRGALAGMLLCAAHGMVRLLVPAAMGGGDVKLAASVGAALGGVSWDAVALGTVLAAVLTAVAAMVPVALGGRRDVLPGPPGVDPRHSEHTGSSAPVRRREASAAPSGVIRRRTASGAVAGGIPRRGALPHGPSMLLACLTVVATAAAWPGAGGAG